MEKVIEDITQLFKQFSSEPVTSIDKLPQAGSERHYFRIHTGTDHLLLHMAPI